MSREKVAHGTHLDKDQIDAMQELSNMAINRAAGKLAELTGRPVSLRVPRVYLLELEELETFLSENMAGGIPCINQSFTGSCSGNSMLVYPRDSAARLASILLDQEKDVSELSALERSALVEVGNILINAFMGFIGEILALSLDFTIPQMAVLAKESVQTVLKEASGGEVEDMVAMMIDNEMSVEGTDVSGHMVILVEVKVARKWIARMEELWLS